jgi:hypothetical protein
MKKINVYTVTYNNQENINRNIQRFVETTDHIEGVHFNYVVINNHSNLNIDPHSYVPMLHKNHNFGVFENFLRPDHSCGHLARDYNMALIHGFQDLNNPACDQVILLHDDSIWNDGWFEDLTELHKKYTFYAGDWGDGLTSYLPDAVKAIGLWDERFCNIGYHEADYFLRAKLFNSEKSTINDHGAGRVWNPTKEIFHHAEENHNKVASHAESARYHDLTHALFMEKWNCSPVNWHLSIGALPTAPLIKSWAFYPYFEKDCRLP